MFGSPRELRLKPRSISAGELEAHPLAMPAGRKAAALDLTRAESGDFHFVDAADPEDGVRKMLAIVRERIPKRFGLDPVRDIQYHLRPNTVKSRNQWLVGTCSSGMTSE
jgi:hypothetical protein